MKELKLGTIADLEGNVTKLNKILNIFSKSKIDLLVLAGDIPSEKKKNSLLNILKKCLKLKVSILIIPGSHESFDDYEKPIKKLNNKLIIDGTKKLKYKFKDFDFIFLPGSDYLSRNGQYALTYSVSGIKKKKKKFKKHSDWWMHTNFRAFQIKKIKKLIKNPNTIIISHIPPKFNSKEAIDVAEFGKVIKPFDIKAKHLKLKTFKRLLKERVFTLIKNPKSGIITKEIAKDLIKYNYPVKIVKKNVGNKDILKLIKQKNIKKLICGHIHEAGNKACSIKGRLIKQNKFSEELFLNSGQAEKGYACIINLKNNLAKYRKIKV